MSKSGIFEFNAAVAFVQGLERGWLVESVRKAIWIRGRFGFGYGKLANECSGLEFSKLLVRKKKT